MTDRLVRARAAAKLPEMVLWRMTKGDRALEARRRLAPFRKGASELRVLYTRSDGTVRSPLVRSGDEWTRRHRARRTCAARVRGEGVDDRGAGASRAWGTGVKPLQLRCHRNGRTAEVKLQRDGRFMGTQLRPKLPHAVSRTATRLARCSAHTNSRITSPIRAVTESAAVPGRTITVTIRSVLPRWSARRSLRQRSSDKTSHRGQRAQWKCRSVEERRLVAIVK